MTSPFIDQSQSAVDSFVTLSSQQGRIQIRSFWSGAVRNKDNTWVAIG